MKSILKLRGLLVISVLIWVGWTILEKPDLDKISEQNGNLHGLSQVTDRVNYADLVNDEVQNSRTFLLNEAAYSVIYNDEFPYSSTKLDLRTTNEILILLNDTSSYRWGEYGTPEYCWTIIYYGNTSEPIGYTQIDPLGEVESFPYRSLMKWGMLTDKRFEELLTIINIKKTVANNRI